MEDRSIGLDDTVRFVGVGGMFADRPTRHRYLVLDVAEPDMDDPSRRLQLVRTNGRPQGRRQFWTKAHLYALADAAQPPVEEQPEDLARLTYHRHTLGDDATLQELPVPKREARQRALRLLAEHGQDDLPDTEYRVEVDGEPVEPVQLDEIVRFGRLAPGQPQERYVVLAQDTAINGGGRMVRLFAIAAASTTPPMWRPDWMVYPVVEWEDGLVAAEAAPLGVQLWPTMNADAERAQTLASVHREITLTGSEREIVIWTYLNGSTRQFMQGEDVQVRTLGRHPRVRYAGPRERLARTPDLNGSAW